MPLLKIARWDEWQTFRKDRGAPPWIKLYRQLLTNPEWVSLSDSEKGQLVSLWIVAADKNGAIPDSPRVLQKICQIDQKPNLLKFIELGFIAAPCQPLGNHEVTTCPQLDAPEESRAEQSRGEQSRESGVPDKGYSPEFLLFYSAWCGTKKKKANAFKEWKKLKPNKTLQEEILLHLQDRQANDPMWIKENRKYQGHPDTFIKERKWEDEWKTKTEQLNGSRRLAPNEEWRIEREGLLAELEIEKQQKAQEQT